MLFPAVLMSEINYFGGKNSDPGTNQNIRIPVFVIRAYAELRLQLQLHILPTLIQGETSRYSISSMVANWKASAVCPEGID